MEDPVQSATAARLETVIVEVERGPEGQDLFNIKATDIRHTGQIWERIIVILQAGLRAAIVQAHAPQEAPSRIVDPAGFVLPPPPARH